MALEITIDTILSMVMTGMFTGIGASLGTYFTNRMLIKQFERALKKEQNSRDEG